MRGTQGFDDTLQHPVEILKHLVVPEAKDSISSRFEVSSPARVGLEPSSVLPTIEFDHQRALAAAEVGDIWTDRLLASELSAIQASITQLEPELSFGLRLAFSK